MHLPSLKERLENPKVATVEISMRNSFIEWIRELEVPNNAKALSISVGDGIWDYLAFKNNVNIKEIVATDVVDNPVSAESLSLLNEYGKWNFVRIPPEQPLAFENESFDLVFHQDTLEHIEKPFLFLSEQYRILKKGGILIFGTPNLFRPMNLFKLVFGKLQFPHKIGANDEIGEYIHIQEYHQRQIVVLLKEVGFKQIQTKYCFFGLHQFQLGTRYPKNPICQALSHYMMFKCIR